MRTRTYVIGILSVIIFLTGAVFKHMHWPGAAMLLGIGLSVFAVIFLPSFLLDKWTFETTKAARRSYLLLFIAMEFIVLSSLFVFLKWPWASEMAYIGIALITIYLVFFFIVLGRWFWARQCGRT